MEKLRLPRLGSMYLGLLALSLCFSNGLAAQGSDSSLEFKNETLFLTSANTGLGFVISPYPYTNPDNTIVDAKPVSLNLSYLPQLKDPVFNWNDQAISRPNVIGKVTSDGKFSITIDKPADQDMGGLPPGMAVSGNDVHFAIAQLWGDLNAAGFKGFDKRFMLNINLQKPTVVVDKSLPLAQRVSNITLGMLIYFDKACELNGTYGKFKFNNVSFRNGWNLVGFSDADANAPGWFTPKEVKIVPLDTKIYWLHFYWG